MFFFFMYFYGSNPGPMGRGQFGPGGQVVLEKKIFECFFLCISMVQTQAPWGGAILDLGVTIRTNLAVLLTRYQASEPSNSRDEDILFSNPRPPQQGHLRPQGHYLNKQGRGPLDNASYQIPTITKCLVVSDVF